MDGPPAPESLMPETIVCVDCGGVAHRLSYPPEEGFRPGDVVAYRCADCRDRWDLVTPDPAADDAPHGGAFGERPDWYR
ncbi:MAG: hypothetical protein ACKVWR_17300 [Acidimicrobiales bacterium]